MKAVIVDASASIAVALRDDGQFVKLKNRAYEIGQEIQINASTVRFPKQAAIAASAALVLFAGAGYGVHEWNSPYSYVSLDVSPSIEYALNRFDVVIAVNGLNEDGETVAESIGDSVRNTKIDKALEITVEALAKDNYISTADNSGMVIAVYSDNDSKKEELLATVSGIQATDGHEVSAVAVDKETMEKIDSGENISTAVTIDEEANVETAGAIDTTEQTEDSSVNKTEFSEGDSSPVKGGEVIDEQSNQVDEATSSEEQAVDMSATEQTEEADKLQDTADAGAENHKTDSAVEGSSVENNTDKVDTSDKQSQESVSNETQENGKKKHNQEGEGSVAKGEKRDSDEVESAEKTEASPSKSSRRARHGAKAIVTCLEASVIED